MIGLTLRLGGGEPAFNLDPFIYYPGKANFPHKTFAMIVSMATLLTVSYLVKFLFINNIIPPKFDVFKCNLAFGGRGIALKKKAKSSKIKNEFATVVRLRKLDREENAQVSEYDETPERESSDGNKSEQNDTDENLNDNAGNGKEQSTQDEIVYESEYDYASNGESDDESEKETKKICKET